MKVRGLQIAFVLLCLSGAGSFWLSPAFADPPCALQFGKMSGEEAQKLVAQTREGLVALATEKNIPGFFKETPTGKVPVLLLNATTRPHLDNYLEGSFGTSIRYQPDWRTDHGLIRVKKFLIDVDEPGDRGFGELNDTGLAWKPLDSYLELRAKKQVDDNYILAEVNYALTPDELDRIDYYQRARRSAVFRVPWTFGGAQDMTQPNTFLNGGEHCFIFSKGCSAAGHVSEAISELKKMGVKDPEAIFQSEEGKTFLANAKKYLNEADANDEALLDYEFLGDPDDMAPLYKFMPAELQPVAGQEASPEITKKRITFVNWMVAKDASEQYADTLKSLKVSRDFGVNDVNNPRATAIFIYDDNGVTEAMNNATFTTKGIATHWNPVGQTKFPNR